MGGQTHLSVVGGEMPGKLGCVCECCVCCASPLAVRADKKGGRGRAADSGFIPQTPPPPSPPGLSFSVQLQVWELTCIKTSETA